MKINTAEFKQIIKEEAMRLKKRMMLEAEKTEILNKLQEMEECELEEGMLGNAWNSLTGVDKRNRKEALIKQFNDFLAAGAIGDMNAFLEKAAGDNFGGTLSLKMGAGAKFAGKKIIIYTLKPTTIQKIAAGSGAMTAGGGSGERRAPLEEDKKKIK